MRRLLWLLVACVPDQPTLHGDNGDLTASVTPSRCAVDGTYRMQAYEARNDPPACSNAHRETGDEGATITVRMVDGRPSIGIGGYPGTCDGGTLNGCELTTKCVIQGGGGSATLQLDFQFQPDGFVGSFDATRRTSDGECRLVELVKAVRPITASSAK